MPQQNSFEHSPFAKLPIELTKSIAEFLPLSDAASLTLTCWSMFSTLGNRYLNLLRSEDGGGDRLAFLKIIQKDLPHLILCHYCHLLHSGTKQRHENRRRLRNGKMPRCTTSDSISSVDLYIQEGFSSITFQSAMKLYRNGLDYSEQLSALTTTKFSRTWDGDLFYHESTPQIVNGHFLLRHQVWIRFPDGQGMKLPRTMLTDVCPHWVFRNSGSGDGRHLRLMLKIACRISHWDDLRRNSRCPTCAGLFQCIICPTEFQIDVKDFGTEGRALVLTRWLDLGEGITPLDSRYASHVSKRCNSVKTVYFKAGSIKAAYEGKHVDIDKLLTPKYTKALFFQYMQLPSPPPAITATTKISTSQKETAKVLKAIAAPIDTSTTSASSRTPTATTGATEPQGAELSTATSPALQHATEVIALDGSDPI